MDIFTLIYVGNVDAARSLIEADPSLINSTLYGWVGERGLLHSASRLGDIDFVSYLITKGCVIDYAPKSNGYCTALCVASEKGHLPVVEKLLSCGALVDGVDATCITPLMNASISGHENIVKTLLQHGANVERLGYIQRFMPLDFAKSWGHAECMKLIQDAGGISVTEDYDWESQPGFPIAVYVSNHIGPIYPTQFKSKSDNTSIRLAEISIKSKPKPLYLFTDELHLTGVNIELVMILPARWAVLPEYLAPCSKLSFPLDIMRELSKKIKNSEVILSEGFLIRQSDPCYNMLGWPDNINALVVVDHQIEGDLEFNSEDGIVSILTLAPLKANGTWEKSEKNLKNTIDKLKTSNWKKFMLPDPLFPDWPT